MTPVITGAAAALLRDIKHHIVNDPIHFDIGLWVRGSGPQSQLDTLSSCHEIDRCGTVACIAGRAALMLGWKKTKDFDTEYIPLDRLPEPVREKLSKGYNREASIGEAVAEFCYQNGAPRTVNFHNLFYKDDWPSDFEEEYDDADNENDFTTRAQVAADRIEQFIADGR